MFGFGKKKDAETATAVGTPPNEEVNSEGKKGASTFIDTESLISDATLMAQKEGVSPIFVAKVQIINKALAEIGMGKYQWELFFAGGFGWFADNIWLQGLSILQPKIAQEFNRPTDEKPSVLNTTLALYVGLVCGAAFWGCSADIIGRRTAWNATLFIGGVFGVAAGGANSFVALCSLIACIGFGVGGNLPVDGTMYLEFLPASHQWLLTFLSIWWAIGQLVASLIAWGFIHSYDCPAEKKNDESGTVVCNKGENMAWRYTYYTYGGMMLVLWALRFFVLPVFESPKFLISHGKDQAAVDVVNKVAMRNKSPIRISIEDFHRAAEPFMTEDEKQNAQYESKFSTMELIKNSFSEFNIKHLSALFSTKRLAWSTSLIVFCYGAVGLAYPLFFSFLGKYLDTVMQGGSEDDAMASYTYQAACGVPGSIAAAFLVTWSRGGRKFAMAFFTILCGVFLFCLTAAKTKPAVNGLTSMGSFFANAFYGVMYGYAPELFPTPSRGTGDALCASFNRITGLFAPIIAMYSNASKTPNGPVMASAGIFVATGVVMLFLPVETRGRTTL